ncbi:AAA family ATPase [Streptomyces sp. NPDC005181]|uniref:AAA family ATPase n=1 Tax=Streptomyces sp. NPDC005181 TaxID=3156869 RepID=UPI0033BDF7EC
MIVWVNGAFGSGKTTLVAELHRRWPEALVYDPERIGYVLRDIVEVPNGNFQHLPLWRRQVASMAVGLVEEYGRPVLAPMTVVHPQYADEIFGALEAAGVLVHHFFLEVSADVLEQRLDARVVAPGDPERDEGARRWGKAQIPQCVAAVDTLRAGTVLLDGERPTRELADEVLAHVGAQSR